VEFDAKIDIFVLEGEVGGIVICEESCLCVGGEPIHIRRAVFSPLEAMSINLLCMQKTALSTLLILIDIYPLYFELKHRFYCSLALLPLTHGFVLAAFDEILARG
jgi:hypothetical protein